MLLVPNSVIGPPGSVYTPGMDECTTNEKMLCVCLKRHYMYM